MERDDDALYNQTEQEYKERQDKIALDMEELDNTMLDPNEDITDGDFNDPDLITAR
jgi:hypothetical protein